MVQLDGLRGIAAIVVMAYHTGNVFGFFSLFARGYLFVDFFFMLSGFVLTGAIEPRFARGWSVAAFSRARAVRLWPMVAVGAVLGAAVAQWTNAQWTNGSPGLLPELGLALVMIPMLGRSAQTELFPLNGPQWSIFFELLANLAHAIVLRRLPTRWIGLFVVVAALAMVRMTELKGADTLGPDTADWFRGLPRLGFAYGAGILLGRLHQTGRLRIACWWLLPFTVLAVLPFLALASSHSLDYADGDLVAVIVAMPPLLWLTVNNSPPEAVAAPLQLLGAMSFPLYAVHLPLLKLAADLEPSARSATIAVIASLIFALVLARLTDPSRMRASLAGRRNTDRTIATASA